MNKAFKRHMGATAIIILAVVILTLALMAVAAFIGSSKSSHVQDTSAFFFSSDLLTESGKTYSICGNSLSFTLSNSDESLRYADNTVSYTVAVTSGTATLSSSSGQLTGGAARSNTIDVTNASGTVTVRAVSAPYSKILTATFVFISDAFYEIQDSDNYCTLIIRAGASTPQLTINWNALNLSPDNTNPLMESWADGSETLYALPANAVYRLIFFKNVAGNYARAPALLNTSSITIGS